ncbi:MAG: chromosome segregation SMC family protein [Candidatus Micrarchaeaceae archaeon]
MLYIDSLVIDKFKSVNHAALRFSKGFNCIVGPNGSGKSTICDSLLFGLGETSSRRLRVEKYDQLIRGITDSDKKLKTAHVKLDFKGDADISLVRYIRSDGKTAYKLNGKNMKKNEVLTTLLKYGMKADETNTISQGEIITLGNMKSTELRELIDLASGIKDFENKKNESIKELEKVDQKISESNVAFNTQKGFLEELKADKESAEKYLSMASKLKILNYSILVLKKNTAESHLTEFSKNISGYELKLQEINKKLDELNKKLDFNTKERTDLTKKLSESNQEMGSTNATLESLNIQTVKVDGEITAFSNSIKELESSIKDLTEEKAITSQTIEKNILSITSTIKKLAPMEERLSKIKLKPEELKSNPKLIENLKSKEEELNKSLELISIEISNVNNELYSDKASLDAKLKEFNFNKLEYDLKNKEIIELNEKIQKVLKSLSNHSMVTKKLELEINKFEKYSLDLDEKLINLREQRASIRQRSNINYEYISQKFSSTKGFFGKISELITYDDKYAFAIEAAVGSRLDYIIVEDISMANNIINFMRENSLGRAAFIPINEIRVSESQSEEKILTPLIETVKYENKYQKAINYIFNNTYLIDKISDSKKYGLGKRRYVTLEGDIVEQSGVVSGGSINKKISSANIENQIKLASEEKNNTKNKIEELNKSILNSRKSEAFAEMELKSLEEKSNTIKTDFKKYSSLIEILTNETSKLKEKISLYEVRLGKLSKDRESTQNLLNETKEKLDFAFKEAVEFSKRIAESGLNDEEIAKIETLRKDAESLKMEKVSFEKENEFLKKRITTIEKEISLKSKSIDSIAQNIKSLNNKKEKLIQERAEIEKKISSGSDQSKKIYNQLNDIDQKISILGNERGKLLSEKALQERQISEAKIRSSQYETNFADLTAELSTYKEKIEVLQENLNEMEKESTILSSKLKDMGNVNQKAPEMYAERLKEVEEASNKLETLKTERQAVMRMIEEIDSKKLQTFMSTLNDVVNNFNKLCGYLFQDKPEIALSDQREPFKSGLIITVKEGKTKKLLTSMSGGEKSLILLILILAIHMCKPSSIYLFDEVDSALDKENSKKLSHLLKQMSAEAQFIVISHNDSLISSADTAIGVAKSNNESKVVGLEISNILNKT